MHVTARVVPAAARLGRGRIHRALRRALRISLARADFRIVELAVRAHRLELVVEADDRVALARGIQGFEVAAARQLNRALGRRGAVFPDRYRARALTTRGQLRAVLASSPGWQPCSFPASHVGHAARGSRRANRARARAPDSTS